jgi:hypothetical protein
MQGVDVISNCGRLPSCPKNTSSIAPFSDLIRVNPEQTGNVRRIFDLYAFHRHSLDSLVATLRDEGRIYSEKHPDFVRSKLHGILTDRSYIGDVKFRGQWLEGKHEPIIAASTFDRVQVLLGNKTIVATSRFTATA